MDKIRAEFKTWNTWYRNKYPNVEITGRVHHAYMAGHKSRDPEVEELEAKNKKLRELTDNMLLLITKHGIQQSEVIIEALKDGE